MRIRGAASILALLALAGCSSDDDSLSGSVSLEVRQQRTGSMYTEGSVSYVRVEALASETTAGGVVEKSKQGGVGPLAKLSVPAGHITVKTWQRPCNGNCDHLDPPRDHCEISFVAAENAQVIVRTTYSPGQSCTADVEGALAQ